MRIVTLTIVLSAALASPVMANDNRGSSLTDAQHIFRTDNAQPMQLAMLSEQEMKETEGAVLQFGIGAGIGFGSYALQNGYDAYSRSGCILCSNFATNFASSWNNGQAIVSAGVGALSGGLSGMALRSSGTTIDYSRTLFLRSFHTPAQQFVNNQMRTYTTAPGLVIKGSAVVGSSAANRGYSYISRD